MLVQDDRSLMVISTETCPTRLKGKFPLKASLFPVEIPGQVSMEINRLARWNFLHIPFPPDPPAPPVALATKPRVTPCP